MPRALCMFPYRHIASPNNNWSIEESFFNTTKGIQCKSINIYTIITDYTQKYIYFFTGRWMILLTTENTWMVERRVNLSLSLPSPFFISSYFLFRILCVCLYKCVFAGVCARASVSTFVYLPVCLYNRPVWRHKAPPALILKQPIHRGLSSPVLASTSRVILTSFPKFHFLRYQGYFLDYVIKIRIIGV